MQPSYLSLRILLWCYFGLLLSEGALRKWFFPSLSTPLLIVRDPVLFLMYAVAMAQGIFPVNGFIIGSVLLAGLTFAAWRLARFRQLLLPAVLAYLVFLGLCTFPMFHEGVENQAERIRAGGGVQHGIIASYLGMFGASLETADRTPLLGHGLGGGTNGGAALSTGSRGFLLA